MEDANRAESKSKMLKCTTNKSSAKFLMTRPPQDRILLQARVAKTTRSQVKLVASSLGYVHGGAGSVGKLLDAIASGEVQMIKTVRVVDK